ncbi:MAG: DUF1576 domain-containing protein, partial [Hungatella sp.]|nr:DUF1576 domain-containing protein [Hungatella sp.]
MFTAVIGQQSYGCKNHKGKTGIHNAKNKKYHQGNGQRHVKYKPAFASHTIVFHEGYNLYNTGFALGILSAFFYAIFRFAGYFLYLHFKCFPLSRSP